LVCKKICRTKHQQSYKKTHWFTLQLAPHRLHWQTKPGQQACSIEVYHLLLLAKMIIYVNTAYRIIRLAGDGFCLGGRRVYGGRIR
jgi:hypothetical protein